MLDRTLISLNFSTWKDLSTVARICLILREQVQGLTSFMRGQLSIFDGKGGAFLLDFLVCVAIKGCNGFLYPGFSEYLCIQNEKKVLGEKLQ